MYSIIESGTKIMPKFGFGYLDINGLIVFTMKLRMKQHSIKHMAFWYVLNVEENLILNKEVRCDKKGQIYVTFKHATTDFEQRRRLFNILTKAQGYVHQHMADEKLGTKTAPDFISFYRKNQGLDNSPELTDDLPW